MEIAPGVHELRLARVRAHVVVDGDVTLIDTGFRGSRPGVARGLRNAGVGLRDVTRIVCTHGHPDHAGSARELQAAAGARVLIHSADAERLRLGIRDFVRAPSRGRFFAAITPPPAQTEAINDGDVLPALGGLRVIHTPGHTPGSVCLYAPRDGILFVGDVLQRRFGRVGFASALYSDDPVAARRSVQRLASLDVELIVFSHFPPLREDAAGVLRRLVLKAG